MCFACGPGQGIVAASGSLGSTRRTARLAASGSAWTRTAPTRASKSASRLGVNRCNSAAVCPPASVTWTVRPILSCSTAVTVLPFRTGARVGLAIDHRRPVAGQLVRGAPRRLRRGPNHVQRRQPERRREHRPRDLGNIEDERERSRQGQPAHQLPTQRETVTVLDGPGGDQPPEDHRDLRLTLALLLGFVVAAQQPPDARDHGDGQQGRAVRVHQR